MPESPAFSVDAHAPTSNPPLGIAARAQSGAGDDLGDALGFFGSVQGVSVGVIADFESLFARKQPALLLGRLQLEAAVKASSGRQDAGSYLLK